MLDKSKLNPPNYSINLYDDWDLDNCEGSAVDINHGEMLSDCRYIYYDDNIYIEVMPDANGGIDGKEYFRVFNKQNNEAATKVARIKIKSSEYVLGYETWGKEEWILSESEINNLIRILELPVNPKFLWDNNKAKTYWQSLLYNYNYVLDGDGETPLPLDLPMPDYKQLKKYL